MRFATILMLSAVTGVVIAPATALAKPDKKVPPVAPAPVSACDPMPYTVERADQSVGLQLKIAGLKRDPSSDKAPLIDGQLDREKLKARAAGEILQALGSVSSVEFCRAAETFPSKADDIIAAQAAFDQDMQEIFAATNFKDDAAKKALRAGITSRCKAPTGACPELPVVVPYADFNARRKKENFTGYVFTSTKGGLDVLNLAAANGCKAYVESSIAQVPGTYLVVLEDAGPIIGQYLAGGRYRVAALTRATTHASVVFAEGSDAQLQTIRAQAQSNPSIGSCLAKVAAATPTTPEGKRKPAEQEAENDKNGKADDKKSEDKKAGDGKAEDKKPSDKPTSQDEAKPARTAASWSERRQSHG